MALCGPLVLAATSPLLEWREPIYILAGFAGIVGLGIMLVQPLLVIGALPGILAPRGRQLHRWIGAALVAMVVIHVFGLWLTSPPDVIDALLFVSPTPFSDWGVIAMWAVFGAALLAVSRKRLRLRPRTWRIGHASLVSISVICTLVHILLIEGTMEPFSKAALGVLALVATAYAIAKLRIFAVAQRPRRQK